MTACEDLLYIKKIINSTHYQAETGNYDWQERDGSRAAPVSSAVEETVNEAYWHESDSCRRKVVVGLAIV